jgi:predicted transcriptional regulator
VRGRYGTQNQDFSRGACDGEVDYPGDFSMSASNPIELACEIVAAFVSNNPLPKGELPSLILAVHTAVKRLAAESESVPLQIEAKTPAVPIRRSITPDFLICLDDGKRFKSLRRHLSGHGMTPEQYREKWNLPSDYPMVAPNYAAQRSALAKQIGLGQIRGKAGVRKSVGHSKADKT